MPDLDVEGYKTVLAAGDRKAIIASATTMVRLTGETPKDPVAPNVIANFGEDNSAEIRTYGTNFKRSALGVTTTAEAYNRLRAVDPQNLGPIAKELVDRLDGLVRADVNLSEIERIEKGGVTTGGGMDVQGTTPPWARGEFDKLKAQLDRIEQRVGPITPPVTPTLTGTGGPTTTSSAVRPGTGRPENWTAKPDQTPAQPARPENWTTTPVKPTAQPAIRTTPKP